MLVVLVFIFKPLDLDRTSLCPEAMHIPKNHIIIVDKTDVWGESSSSLLERKLLEIMDAIAMHEKITVYTLSENIGESKSPLFVLCSPGKPEEVNMLHTGTEFARKEYVRKFATPLKNLAYRLKQPKNASQTPIVQVLAKIVKNEMSNSQTNTFVFFSDMRQNSNLYSVFHRSRQSEQDLTNAFRAEGVNLSGYEVEVNFIAPAKVQWPKEKDLRDLWAKSIEALGGSMRWESL